MSTVKEVNKVFAEQGLEIKLPYPEDWMVQDIQIVEKREEGDRVKVLLALKMFDSEGKDVSDLYFSETRVKREKKPKKVVTKHPLKEKMLPERPSIEFKSDEEAWNYMKDAFSALLRDKGYEIKESDLADIYAEKGKRKFLLKIALRSGEEAEKKVEELVNLRKKYGNEYDYGLVLPAFSEPLGVSRFDHERWISERIEYLSKHRIGLFGVDNKNPNLIYLIPCIRRKGSFSGTS